MFGDEMAARHGQRVSSVSSTRIIVMKPRHRWFWPLLALLCFGGGWIGGSSTVRNVVQIRLIKVAKMSNYTASGAGTAACNNTYVATGNTFNGAPTFMLDSGHYLFRSGVNGAAASGWFIAPAVANQTVGQYPSWFYQSNTDNPSTPPLTGWQVGNTAAPAPTLSLSAAVATRTPDLMPFF